MNTVYGTEKEKRLKAKEAEEAEEAEKLGTMSLVNHPNRDRDNKLDVHLIQVTHADLSRPGTRVADQSQPGLTAISWLSWLKR